MPTFHSTHSPEPVSGGRTANPKHVAGLDLTPAEDGCVVYQPQQDRISFLNPTAAIVLELCNGEHSPEEIAILVQQAYQLPEPPSEDVAEALRQFKADGLLL